MTIKRGRHPQSAAEATGGGPDTAQRARLRLAESVFGATLESSFLHCEERAHATIAAHDAPPSKANESAAADDNVAT